MSRLRSLLLLYLLGPFLLSALAQHSHGHTTTSSAHSHMTAFLHFFPGDTLWFEGWVPNDGWTIFGACVGLFLLGVGERWVAAVRAAVEVALVRERKRNTTDVYAKLNTDEKTEKMGETKTKNQEGYALLQILTLTRGSEPFAPAHAWARGVLQIAQSMFAILFMLVLMTFQTAFIIAIIAGLGAGEMMYGRFTDAAMTAVHGHGRA